MRVDLSKFDSQKNFDRGASAIKVGCWYAVKMFFFLTAIPWKDSWKRSILRFFGATIGDGVIIKPRVNIHFPWKLSIGSYSWIGEEVCIMNFEKIEIGTNCCISQRAFLCSGNHDYKDLHMSYKHAPILVGDGAWIGAQCFISPGTQIGEECVITAGSVASGHFPKETICSGNPAEPRKMRWQ